VISVPVIIIRSKVELKIKIRNKEEWKN